MDINTELSRIMNAAIERAEHKAKTEPCNHCGGIGSKYVRGPWNPDFNMYDPGYDEACWHCAGKGFIYVW